MNQSVIRAPPINISTKYFSHILAERRDVNIGRFPSAIRDLVNGGKVMEALAGHEIGREEVTKKLSKCKQLGIWG